jgi:hypothetical protein
MQKIKFSSQRLEMLKTLPRLIETRRNLIEDAIVHTIVEVVKKNLSLQNMRKKRKLLSLFQHPMEIIL